VVVRDRQHGDEHEDALGSSDRGGKDNNGLRAPSKSSGTSVATKAMPMEKNDKLPTKVCIICTLYTCMHIF
jgi:hypothetical protein